MKKRIFALLMTLVLCLSFALPASATKVEKRHMADNAELLTDSQRQQLQDTLRQLSAKHKMDIVIVTVDSLEGKSPTSYADDYFDYNGYGWGDRFSGILLLISTEDRDWAISTCGYAMEVFTDDGLDYIAGKIIPALSDGDYADAFAEFASLCDTFLVQASTGEPFDNNTLPKEPFSLLWIPGSLVIGLVIGWIVVAILKNQLKSVRSQSAARDYLRQGSLQLRVCSDLFLYRTVRKTPKPKNNSSHRSSSGRSHGGASGKF